MEEEIRRWIKKKVKELETRKSEPTPPIKPRIETQKESVSETIYLKPILRESETEESEYITKVPLHISRKAVIEKTEPRLEEPIPEKIVQPEVKEKSKIIQKPKIKFESKKLKRIATDTEKFDREFLTTRSKILIVLIVGMIVFIYYLFTQILLPLM